MALPRISDFSHFLIIQTAFVGDCVLTAPLFAFLKKQCPGAVLRCVSTPVSTPLFQLFEECDEAIVLNKKNVRYNISAMARFAKEVRSNDECVISPHRSARSAILTSLMRPRYSVGFSNSSLSPLYSRTVQYQPHLHEAKRIMSLLRGFSEFQTHDDFPVERPTIHVDNSLIPEDYLYLRNRSNRIATLFPGSVWATKQWGKEQYIQLAVQLKDRGIDVVVLGSEADMEISEWIANQSGSLSLAGKTTLAQTIAVLRHSDVAISNDSAPVHLAWLVNCKIVAIFGPTTPEIGFAPLSDTMAIQQHLGLSCRPCSIHGQNICPIGTHECMTSISVNDVMNSVWNLLNI